MTNLISKRCISTFFLVSLVVCSEAYSQKFVEVNTSLPGLNAPTLAWGDYDNDGLLDLFITGYPGSGGYIARIYKNMGNGVFTEQTNQNFVTGVGYGSADWGDYDNDGDLDLIFSGNDGINGYATYLYRNNSGVLELQTNTGLAGIAFGSVHWGDYDNDGYLDILINGSYGVTGIPFFTRVYRNNHGTNFTEQIDISLIGTRNASTFWLDYNNDGRLDIFVSGEMEVNQSGTSFAIATFYKNEGNNVYSLQTSIQLDSLVFGVVVPGDYDSDGDQDIFMLGWVERSQNITNKLYMNNGNNSFTVVPNAVFASGSHYDADWGDYDNDGRLDLLLTDQDSTRIYRNHSDGTFSEASSLNLPGRYEALAACGDYDNDGDLDVAIDGRDLNMTWYGDIYENKASSVNLQPSAPTNLKFTASDGEVLLSWDKATDDLTPQNGITYNVYVGTIPNQTDVVSPMSNLANGRRLIPQVGNASNRNFFRIAGLSGGTTYYWGVQAIDNSYSGSTFATGQFEFFSLTATTISPYRINLQWAPSTSPEKFRIYRKSGNDLIQIDSVDGQTRDYADSNLTPFSQYEYQVTAVNNNIVSDFSNLASATTFGISPTQPQALNSLAVSPSQINLSWSASSNNPERYRIFRFNGSSFSQIDSANAPSISYSDTGLYPNTEYTYKIMAVNVWGLSDTSNESTDTTFTSPPKAPTLLAAVTLSYDKIRLTWTASPWSPASYRIFRKNGLNFVQIDSVDADSTAYTDSGLILLTTYEYKVFAVNQWGMSAASEIAQTETFGVPPNAPAQLKATAVSSSGINLTWTASSNNPERYRIFRFNGSSFSQIDSVNAPDTTYANTGLTPLNYYVFKVNSFNQWGVSAFSIASGDTTVDPVPPSIQSYELSNSRPSAGTNLTISVQSQNATSMALEYGIGGQNQMNSQNMTFNGGVFAVTIPSAAVTAAGLWFRIRGENRYGSTYYPSANSKATIPVVLLQNQVVNVVAQGAYPIGTGEKSFYTIALPFQGSINLIPLLGKQDRNTRDGLPGNWRLIKYDSDGGYTDATTMEGNTGYFIYHDKNHSVDLFSELDTVITNDFELFNNIILRPGWNLVPWPYAFSATLVRTDPQKIGSIWDRTMGSWQQTTTAMPFGAYGIRNKTGSNVKMSNVIQWTQVVSKIRQPKTELTWEICLKVDAQRHTDWFNFLGTSASAENGLDELDEEEPMMLANDISLYFETQCERGTKKLSRDVRDQNTQGHVWDFTVENSSESRMATLSWETTNLPNDYQLALIDVSNNKFVGESTMENSYKIEERKTRFKMIVGTPSYVQNITSDIRESMPEKFFLSQNYPNPFNPTTTILFDIARSSHVRIRVYNMLGQEVTTLVNRYYETGRNYQANWNGKDGLGREVASGVYIYRLEAGKTSKTKKMLFVK